MSIRLLCFRNPIISGYDILRRRSTVVSLAEAELGSLVAIYVSSLDNVSLFRLLTRSTFASSCEYPASLILLPNSTANSLVE